MADTLQTLPLEFGGGLITSLSPLQQGTKAPGSARKLINFESSVGGGYKRLEGYVKYSDDIVGVSSIFTLCNFVGNFIFSFNTLYT